LKLANQKPLHAGILVLLTAVTAWTLNSIPSWRGWVADPCALATLAFAAILIFFWVNFVLEKYGLKAELRWSAGALCGMPIVYIAKYVVSTRSLSASDGSLRLELLAVALFGSLGLARSHDLPLDSRGGHSGAWNRLGFMAQRKLTLYSKLVRRGMLSDRRGVFCLPRFAFSKSAPHLLRCNSR
jgi:hypothetical protein